MESFCYWKKRKNSEKDGPKKIPRDKLCVNLTQCKHKIFHKVFEERNWQIIKNDEENRNCDLIFTWISEDFDIFSKLKPF